MHCVVAVWSPVLDRREGSSQDPGSSRCPAREPLAALDGHRIGEQGGGLDIRADGLLLNWCGWNGLNLRPR